MGPSFKVRAMVDGDGNFVRDSWKRGMRKMYPQVSEYKFYEWAEAHVSKLIAQHGVHIACDPDDENYILAWACVGEGQIHFIYVKHPLRGAGVATRLLGKLLGKPEGAIPCTHWTRHAESYAAKKPGAIYFAPSLLEAA
jgi:GNAT superfamily N-acetyltransferase